MNALCTVQAMRSQEAGYTSSDYIHDKERRSFEITEECRLMMCHWCYQVVDYYRLSREYVQTAMSCLDRFLSTEAGSKYLSSHDDFQLVTVACLYLAIKCHSSTEVDLGVFLNLSRGLFTRTQILKLEMEILESLQWKICPPTAMCFVRGLAMMLLPSATKSEMANLQYWAEYQTELAVFDYSLSVKHCQSTVAVACVLNALTLAPGLSKAVRCILLRVSSSGAVDECRERLHGLLNVHRTDIPAQLRPDSGKKQKESTVRITSKVHSYPTPSSPQSVITE